MPTTTIPARHGAHTLLKPGQQIRVINPSGTQVVDLWAFPASPSSPTWMSMAQSRSKLLKVRPEVGDTFIDTHRRPVLTLTKDTSPGVHDMLFPACDAWRYCEAGHEGHDSCAGNLRTELESAVAVIPGEKSALRALEQNIRTWAWTPEPLNLFMNVPVGDGKLGVKKPVGKEGDYVVLRAESECLVVMSACPNDLMDTNAGRPGDAAFEVLG